MSPKSHARSEAGRSNVESTGWAGKLHSVDWALVHVVLGMPQNPQEHFWTSGKFGSCALSDMHGITLLSPRYVTTHRLIMSEVPLHGFYDLPCLVRTILLLGACFSHCSSLRFFVWNPMIPYHNTLDLHCSYEFVRRLLSFERLVYAHRSH